MLGIFADNHNGSVALDYLAFLANFLNGRFNFHFYTFPSLFSCFMAVLYFARQVIRPFVRSYTDTSTVTLSPGSIQI